jgi:signal recognition particle receptor subunit beta
MTTTPPIVLKRIQIVKEQNLKSLDLGNDWNTPDKFKLTEFPLEILELTELEELDLSFNRISIIPAEISQLKKLNNLDLSYNDLSTIPEAIATLQNISTLYLSGNQFTTFPTAITQLRKLSTLYLGYNHLTTVPEAIAYLQNLSTLYLNNNQLKKIPEAITQIKNLSALYLNHNQIKTLSESITNLQNLSTLDLRFNPIENPPLEVINKGIAAIRSYFRQLSTEGKDYLYEAKLLVLGESYSGKTTLVKKLQNPKIKISQQENATKGIEVIEWNFPTANKQEFRVNIWDFGGHTIYHRIHQFFLTKRSLYILVTDNRPEEHDFNYWLNLIKLLGNDSPFLIIKNEKQDIGKIINELQLRVQFPNLREILSTNLANNRGLAEVIGKIKQYLTSLPHVGIELPKTWVKVREFLEKDPRNYISLKEYLRICKINGFTQIKDTLQLSSYLHDLGICLHFQDDPILNKIIILNPKWATDAVYSVLNNQKIVNNFGRFNWQDLQEILDEKQYQTRQGELLQLMMRFRLCYEVLNYPRNYVAPRLLSEKRPEYVWNENENTILRYTYQFMPKGIITQIIVLMNNLIHEQQCVWKHGVILNKDGTLAEIVENYQNQEIKVRVRGKNKKELLTLINLEFEKIHNFYQHLKYSRLIPCNCVVCRNSQNPYFFAFENLKKRISARKYKLECEISYQTVSILKLVDEVLDISKEQLFNEKLDSSDSDSDHELYSQSMIQEEKISSPANQNNNKSQILLTAVREIKHLLEQLATEYSNNVIVAAKAIEKLEGKPELKARVIDILKETSSADFSKAVNHPSVGILTAALKGFIEN